ncbi:fatty acid desaturase [Endozoicomonas atrinae]|uniref:fatty acid desaturase n=1 Tax=Endozoicomonas atrinae TaxID=1333660 RepID=UPI000A561D73|nr:fatty acid desaturase [Endozoicomonas atrinae]
MTSKTKNTKSAGSEVDPGFLLVFIVPVLIVLTIYSAELLPYYANYIVWIPLFVVFVLVPFLNIISSNSFFYVSSSYMFGKSCFMFLLRLMPLCKIMVFYYSLNFFQSEYLNIFGMFVWVLSVGFCSALDCINISHELIHSRYKFDRFIGCLLLSFVCFARFRWIHLYIHHRYVATPIDSASAKRGEGLYSYLWNRFGSDIKLAYLLEYKRLKNKKIKVWKNQLMVWDGISLLCFIGCYILWGAEGVIFYVLQSFFAVVVFEIIDYLQHYGLSRESYGNNHFEPVADNHSWSQDSKLTNFILLNLMHHADHHKSPGKSFNQLQSRTASPKYPYDFSFMILSVLIPCVFFRIANPVLDQLYKKNENKK